MDTTILGLLLIKSMTIYEIRGFIQSNLSSAYSDSMGSIQAGVRKLLKNEYITVKEFLENGTLKKEYTITSMGILQFMDWIRIPMDSKKFKNSEMSKFFFMGMAPKDVRIDSLKEYITELKAEKTKMERIQQYVKATRAQVIDMHTERIEGDYILKNNILRVADDENLVSVVKAIYKYQIASLDHSLNQLNMDIGFYSQVLRDELG